ncbi:unnamed protein product [Moneuplotes crassus]|uniref:RRM domain-containing protein n=1 Tax=Euplotes crassus TaxID=5936 RepID=A0AAD1XI35_EUPCR|nr:unnamed protein product [Moneuplotes crassus]
MFTESYTLGLADQRTLLIGDLEPWMTERYLGNIFAKISKVVNIKIAKDRISNAPAGYGYIEFLNHEHARSVYERFQDTPLPGISKKFKFTWTSMANTHELGDPIAPAYHKYTYTSSAANVALNEENDEVDLINAAMKLNQNMAGGASDESLSSKFYYHIPDPTITYTTHDLKNYGKDSYQDPNAYQHSEAYPYHQPPSYGSYAPQNTSGQYDYGYGYPQQPCHQGQYPGYPGYQGYDYSSYYAQYQQPQPEPPKVEPDISIKFYEDINAEEITGTPMDDDVIKDKNELEFLTSNKETLFLF